MDARLLRASLLVSILAVVLLLVACTGDSKKEANEPPEAESGGLLLSIEGTCRLAETGSDIQLSYRVERTGEALISRVRLFVDGAVTEEAGRVTEPVYARNATIQVPDRTTHVFQLSAEAGSARSTASTTIRCTAPSPGLGL